MDYVAELLKQWPQGLEIIATIYVVWFIAHFYYVRFRGIERNVSIINKRIDEDVNILNSKITQVLKKLKLLEKNQEDFQKSLYELKDGHNSMVAFLSSIHPEKSRALKQLSPIEIVDLGYEILEKSGLKKAIDRTYDELVEDLEKHPLKSKYDVQHQSIWVIARNFDNDEYLDVKDFMYENPNYKGEKIRPDLIITLGGIHLRDLYLKRNKERYGDEEIKDEITETEV